MKKLGGYICDNIKCRKFFTHEPETAHGKKRILHFCSLSCKIDFLKKKHK